MTDLERFFRQLVNNLATLDPDRLTQPVRLAEIRRSILPYRANRRALELESSEDYELVLIRLCAGDGGFVRTTPDEVQAEFAAEMSSPNPDLTIVDRHEDALVTLEARPLARVLDRSAELAFAPPPDVPEPKRSKAAPPSPPRVSKPPKPVPPPEEAVSKVVKCSRCGSGLPIGRVVNFCPQCGQNLSRTRCPTCSTELQRSWRHCVNCGTALPED